MMCLSVSASSDPYSGRMPEGSAEDHDVRSGSYQDRLVRRGSVTDGQARVLAIHRGRDQSCYGRRQSHGELSHLDDANRQRGTLVTAHCFTSEGARNAMEGGVGCIEHGSLIDEDTLKLMASKGVHLCPTLVVQDVSALQSDS